MNATRFSRPPGFSLVELLVVIAIIALLATLSLPAIGGIQRSARVSGAGQILGDAIIFARQEASGKNRAVEVRLIGVGNPPAYRAFQIWSADERGAMRPAGNVTKFPEGALLSSDRSLSPLLGANPDIGGRADFGDLEDCEFSALRIRAGGLPDPSINKTNNFLTLHAETDTALPPVNYYTIRLDPATGRIAIHRP